MEKRHNFTFSSQKTQSTKFDPIFLKPASIHWPGSEALNPALTSSRTWWRNSYKNPGSSSRQPFLINFTQQREGKAGGCWGMVSPSHSISGGPWRGHLQTQAPVDLCSAPPTQPLTGSSTQQGVRARLNAQHNPDLRWELSDHQGQGEPFLWPCWVMTGLLLLLIPPEHLLTPPSQPEGQVLYEEPFHLPQLMS